MGEPLNLVPGPISVSHTYRDDGIFAVVVEVTDDDGGVGVGTSSVTVENVAPIVGPIIASPDPIDVHSGITSSADFTDPGALDTQSAPCGIGVTGPQATGQ